jgi:hypothetical protein
MTVRTSSDVTQGGPDAEYITLDVEEVVQTVRSLAREYDGALAALGQRGRRGAPTP